MALNPFFQSLVDSGRLTMQAPQTAGAPPILPPGFSGSARPNFEFEAALRSEPSDGDDRPTFAGQPSLPSPVSRAGTPQTMGDIFKGISDFLDIPGRAQSVTENLPRAATEFGASSLLSGALGATLPGAALMSGLVHGAGNVFEGSELREALGFPDVSFFNTFISDFFGRSKVFDFAQNVRDFDKVGFEDGRTTFEGSGLDDPGPGLTESMLFGDPLGTSGISIERGDGGDDIDLGDFGVFGPGDDFEGIGTGDDVLGDDDEDDTTSVDSGDYE